ncbi:Protein artichoke like protein [Argiope bruennichi]|uniref:Protein artichoke like protein n=1 Tax=Argiope bruennichi TaxID=94029 RepID=A0A8T0G2M4_ARGBR|nr:Protein artichoke like protein [Argiope bruennichi]
MRTKICTLLLLLLGVALPALSSRCPDSDRLPTSCLCDDEYMDEEVDLELSCSGSTLDEFNDALRLFDTNSKLEVQLDEMNLGTLPSRLFDGWNVVKLDISHCELNSLAPQGQVALAGLEDTLESLVITASFNEENQRTKLDLSHLRRLTSLDLSYNAITELSDDWFARGPASLTDLVLSNNGIEKIGDRAFANLVNLDKLELHGNRFGPVKRSMLPRPANRLENLELDNNALSSFPDDFFDDLPALKILAMTNNGFARLPERVFKKILSQLELLDVRGNPIECDSTMKWLFHVKNDLTIFGTCHGPEDKQGVDLDDFIERKGQ